MSDVREGHVASSDNTPIGWVEVGHGRPLLLVHGSRADCSAWNGVAQRLSARYRVAAMDRRGRGRSGDNDVYTLDLEADDVWAVASALGDDVSVVGHSMGGTIVLRACARRRGFNRVMVYEPSIPGMVPPIGPPRHEALAICRLDDPEEAFLAFLRSVIGRPEETIERYRESPSWATRVALFPSYIRELDALEASGPDLDRYRSIACPVQVLMGADTGRARWEATEKLAATIPGATVHPIDGQQHDALRDAPDKVADLIDHFVAGT